MVLTDLPHIVPLAAENAAANAAAAGAGAPPLVVPYAWGEPAAALAARVAAAAGAGCGARAAAWADSGGGGDTSGGGGGGFQADVIIGADLLYDPAGHAPLLASLAALAAPHTQVRLAFRDRRLGEGGFAGAAAGAGWAVVEAPPHLLHEEFQGGDYRALALARL